MQAAKASEKAEFWQARWSVTHTDKQENVRTQCYIFDIMLYYNCTILHYITLYYIILYCIVLYYIILCYIILYYIILYYIILYYIILYYIAARASGVGEIRPAGGPDRRGWLRLRLQGQEPSYKGAGGGQGPRLRDDVDTFSLLSLSVLCFL